MKGYFEEGDHCFDCGVDFPDEEEGHEGHDTLSKRTKEPPPLGVAVQDGVGADDHFGGA